MEFPAIPHGLGDNFGDFDGMGTTSFSLEDFDLDDAVFTWTKLSTSSAISFTEAARTSGESFSHPPHLSLGDPIPIIHSLETHAWITHRRPVNFFHCFLLSTFLALAR